MAPILALFFLLQTPTAADLLAIEDSRSEQIQPLIDALLDPDFQLQAIRAIGRLERPDLAHHLTSLRKSESSQVRTVAVRALAQMGAEVDFTRLLRGESDSAAQVAILEAVGRVGKGGENLLRGRLKSSEAGLGAVRGLYFWARRKGEPLAESTHVELRRLALHGPALHRRVALAALHESGDRDLKTLQQAMEDPDPQVRMLAVRSLGAWKDDPSYLVRYEALKANRDCERAEAALTDPSVHVRLLAVNLLGNDCSATPIWKLVEDPEQDWLTKARGLTSLARVAPDQTRRFLPALIAQSTWWARAAAAEAAKIIGDEATRKALLLDNHPNVVAEALLYPQEAVDALESDDYGLLMKATEVLKDWQAGATAVPALLRALIRTTAEGRLTSRSPRLAMLGLIRTYGDASTWPALKPLLADRDPVVGSTVAEILTEKTGTVTAPTNRRLDTQPLPSGDYMRGLVGSRAVVRMRDAGSFLLQLIPEEAPVTVATFSRLAESGYYTGLTLHRIVPNFVIQGGSPGANEFVGTDGFIRDEVGGSHLRGTVGISTRGRDTGDSQIFINLVDNYRLDHSYTVFARVVDGMEVVDQITQSDVIADVQVLRGGEPGQSRTPPQSFISWTESQFPSQVYRKRRDRALAVLSESGTTLLVPSRRGRSGGQTFQQHPDFLYFTGLELPDSVLMLRPPARATLFVPNEDSRFTASGRRNDFPGSPLAADPKLARLAGVQEVRPIQDLVAEVRKLVLQSQPISLNLGRSGPVSADSPRPLTLEQALSVRLTNQFREAQFGNALAFVAQLRSVKDSSEIRALRLSAEVTSKGIQRAASQIRDGVDERTLEGVLEAAFKAEGAQRIAFDSIIKSGPNSLWPWRILAAHSNRRNRVMRNGDLVIFDVGCQFDNYVSDVGRTFPVSGRFSSQQRETLEMVTSVSDAIIHAVRPGITFAELRQIAQERMPEDQRQFMQTGLFYGHHIGLETGDPSLPDEPLKPGMVFTIEPWYYNHEMDLAVFVEDVILVTENGAENLTRDLPRDPAGLERLVRKDR